MTAGFCRTGSSARAIDA